MYNARTWVNGEILDADKMNHLEYGVVAVSANGAIGTANLADNAVTSAKIADGAVTAAKLGADVSTVFDNKANIDGSYESMTVGNAEQLVSSVGIEEQTPYNFRTSGGSTEIGDREELNAVVGGTVAWNQYCDYNESTPTANWSLVNATLSISGRKMTITSESNSSVRKGVTLKNFLSKANHKYLVSGYITPDASNNAVYGFYNAGVAVDRKIVPYADGKTDISTIFGISASGYDFEILTANATPSGSSCVAEDVMLMDLTQMLGSTIADYIYALEQSNAGAGVAYFRKLFPKPYYAYNSGELMSVRTNLHKMVGFNAYNPDTGTAKVVGGNQYQITGAYTALSLDGTTITPDANGKFTPSANGTLTVTGGNSTTTCVHLVWDGERDGEYEPYEAHTYTIDDVELRGILKLDASNNLYADGDRYLPDGTVERRFAERTYQSGDESLADAITDGTTTVYKITTPTTETADTYQQTQIVDDFGTEEFVDAAVEAGERDVAIPVGNETVYKPNLRAKLEMAPDSPDGDGDYIVRQTNGTNSYIPLVEVKELPDMPSEDGSYKLRCTVSNGTATLSWISDS